MGSVMKISPHGQIRIPKKLMETLGIDKGDFVEIGLIDLINILIKRFFNFYLHPELAIFNSIFSRNSSFTPPNLRN